MNNSILIAKNVPLEARLRAKEIWVDTDGNVTIVVKHFGPEQKIPYMSLEYFDSLCSRFYYSNYTHANAIADIMLLNGMLTRNQYDEFYSNLRNTLETNHFTVVHSELFQ